MLLMVNLDFKLSQISFKQAFLGTLLFLLIGAAFLFVYRFNQVFLTMFVAIVISTAIRPIVSFLKDKGVPNSIGIMIVFLTILLLIIVALVLLVPLFVEQSNVLMNTVPGLYADLRENMLQHPNFFVWRIASELPETMNVTPAPPPTAESGEEQVIENVGNNLRLIGVGARTGFYIVAALLLAFYWTLNGAKNRAALLSVIQVQHRERAREIVDEIRLRLGAFVRGQTILALVIGALSMIAYLIIGLPYAVPLAIIAGIMEVVPVIGPILGAVPALIVGYTVDPNKALLVLLATIVIQQLENNILVPRIMKRAVGVNPLVTLLALAAFGSFFGLLGAVVAIPLAAIIQLLINQFLVPQALPTNNDVIGRDEVSVLQYEVQELTADIRQLIRQKPTTLDEESDHVEDTLEAIAADMLAVLTADLKSKSEAAN